jgi:hypothetical protein
MSVLGINFTKIEAERKSQIKGQININNNIAINDVKKNDFKIADQDSLKIEFEFTAKFEPNVGNIVLKGDTILVNNPEKTQEILAQFKKDKKLPEDVLEQVMNNLLTKCNIEALVVGREVGLPPTLNMPKVKAQEKSK